MVEGDAEQIMIPAMLRAVFGVTPDELGFSVIPMSSAFFDHVAVIFADDDIFWLDHDREASVSSGQYQHRWWSPRPLFRR